MATTHDSSSSTLPYAGKQPSTTPTLSHVLLMRFMLCSSTNEGGTSNER